MDSNFYVDLHCHPNLKSFNSGHPQPEKNMWENIEHPCAENAITRLFRKKSNSMLKSSQCNLYAMAKGGVRVAVLSLYPFEKGFLKFRQLPNLIFGEKNVNDVIEHITAIKMERLLVLQQQDNHYFHDLTAEYNYVEKGQGESPDKRYNYKIVNNYNEIEQTLKNEPNTICIILSIEGGHALGCGNLLTEAMSHEQLLEELSRNIRAMKQWKHVPFNMNLAHHFWNQLTGHAPSIPFPFTTLVNQMRGMNGNITAVGWHVLKELLGTHNGKRILIDTKHMSIPARKEYYKWVKKQNEENPEDKIPIIASHVGMNGFETMDDSVAMTDNNGKSRKSFLHRRSINVSDEEARIIHDSGGILGLMMDKGNIAGFQTLARINTLEKKEQIKDAWCEVLWTNIFQAVKAVKKKTAWDVIGIGTDYDGGISHVDIYSTAESFPDIEKNMTKYLDKTKMNKEYWYGYKPHDLVEKIMRKNSMEFFKRNFK